MSSLLKCRCVREEGLERQKRTSSFFMGNEHSVHLSLVIYTVKTLRKQLSVHICVCHNLITCESIY